MHIIDPFLVNRASKKTFSVQWVVGWVVGLIGIKAISASNQVEVEVEAELGNNE